MPASQVQFRRVRDRFGSEVAGISIVLSGWAKLYSFPTTVDAFVASVLRSRC